MTPEQAATVARVRATMTKRRSSVITREESRGLRAWRYMQTAQVSAAEAARVFDVTTGAIGGAKKRLGKPARTEREIAIRAGEAAHFIHDSVEPCTFAGAALLFAVDADRVIDAWQRLFPEERRVRVG